MCDSRCLLKVSPSITSNNRNMVNTLHPFRTLSIARTTAHHSTNISMSRLVTGSSAKHPSLRFKLHGMRHTRREQTS